MRIPSLHPFPVLLCLLLSSLEGRTGGAVAMVADVQGRAQVRMGAITEVLTLALELQAGHQVSLGPSSRVVLIAFPKGEEVSLTGPGDFTLLAGGEVKGPAGKVRRTPAPAAPQVGPLKPGGLAQASVVMRDPVDGLAVYLPGPAVEGPGLTFRWAPQPQGIPVEVRLMREDSRVVWEGRSTADHQAVPGSIPLPPGATFIWEVKVTGGAGPASEARGTFRVLTSGERAELDRLRKGARTFAQRFHLAARLQVLGLREEARGLWANLSRERPEDPVLKAYLR